MKNLTKNLRLAILGLGYVGLPLALEFSKKRDVIGFDIKKKRIEELKIGFDSNSETDKITLKNAKNLFLTSDEKKIKSANCFIITVPTPIDKFNKPDLNLLLNATKLAAKYLKKKDLIIYESTVYPGCIEENCIPILKKISGLKFNIDFFCGYSPERINPGDKKYTISKIKKITSGSTPETANLVTELYNEIITAGTHKVSSIKIAEAAKVIENTQRDLNIAFINELSIIFNKMGIDTQEVLEAAETKWNFMKFRPGLVGGHCIGVDPYYLTYKSISIGYKPKIILAGRRINDEMGNYVAIELANMMKKKKIQIKNSKILIMGLSFKENCSDCRNSGVEKVFKKLKKFKCNLDIYDPIANIDEVKKIYGVYPIKNIKNNYYDAIILAVSHDIFKNIKIKEVKNFCKKKHIIYDLKYLYLKKQVDMRL